MVIDTNVLAISEYLWFQALIALVMVLIPLWFIVSLLARILDLLRDGAGPPLDETGDEAPPEP